MALTSIKQKRYEKSLFNFLAFYDGMTVEVQQLKREIAILKNQQQGI